MSSEEDIRMTIARFANSFDLKDWALMESVLAEELTVEYSDLRGDPRNRPCPRGPLMG